MAVQETAASRLPTRRPKGRRRKVKRMRDRRFVYGAGVLMRSVCKLGLLLAVMLLVGMGARDAGPPEYPVPDVPGPSLASLNSSIESAEAYLDGLYRPLPGGKAVQSETYTIPLRVRFHASSEWMLLGAGKGGCVAGCPSDTTITPGSGSASSESYKVTFGSRLAVNVKIDWGFGTNSIKITVTPIKVTERSELWLNDVRLATFTAGDKMAATKAVPKSKASSFQSLRYTVRHAVQEAYMYHKVRGNVDKARALAAFLESNGYEPGMDIRAPMFGQSGSLPDDLLFNDQSYEDCRHQPAPSNTSYPYLSKVCLAKDPFLFASAHDGLLQAYAALHMAGKYGPDEKYRMGTSTRWWLQGSTSREASSHLQRQWRRTGFGIPSCTPLTCSDQASGIRTSAFGSLQVLLGYEQGSDATARKFADAAAAATIKSQVRNGEIRLPTVTLYRPIQNGSFPVAWDKEGYFVAPSDPTLIGGPVMLLTGKFSMPPEYRGVQASNTETSIDAWAFLVRYRCAKYGVGCIL